MDSISQRISAPARQKAQGGCDSPSPAGKVNPGCKSYLCAHCSHCTPREGWNHCRSGSQLLLAVRSSTELHLSLACPGSTSKMGIFLQFLHIFLPLLQNIRTPFWSYTGWAMAGDCSVCCQMGFQDGTHLQFHHIECKNTSAKWKLDLDYTQLQWFPCTSNNIRT